MHIQARRGLKYREKSEEEKEGKKVDGAFSIKYIKTSKLISTYIHNPNSKHSLTAATKPFQKYTDTTHRSAGTK